MRVVSIDEVSSALRAVPGAEPRVVVSGNFATPWELLGLAERALEHCRLFAMNAQPGWPRRDGVINETPFVGEGVRSDERLDYLPMRLSLVPRLFSSARPPDVALIHTSPPRDGKVSLGIEVNILPAAIEEVRRRGGLVVAQVNRHMPYTRGDADIDTDLIDLAIEVDGPLASPAPRELDDDAQVVGAGVAALAGDGATIQMGIGQLPDAAAQMMIERRHLGVWSEMVSDGVLHLEQAGALDRDQPVVSTFLFGSPELYEWAHDNPRLLMGRTEVVNDPGRIAAHPAMLSINTALQVDLYAQANASYVRGRIYSGFGGQPDFVSGALHSKGGHSVIALRSWHDKSGQSNIVPMLATPMCSFQHSAIVTEQGTAAIFGRSQHAQARLLIDHAAHPAARDELRVSAKERGLAR
ncbi:MAG: acetyl-CoA hydrolase/transferase family protein [Acidimicrobiales bacterium]